MRKTTHSSDEPDILQLRESFAHLIVVLWKCTNLKILKHLALQ